MNSLLLPTIGIDCRLLGPTHAGIGRYIENLLLQIPSISTHHNFHWTFIFHDQSQYDAFLGITDQSAFFASSRILFAPVRHYTLNEQITMLSLLKKEKLDLLHVPHFNVPVLYRGKLVVTIHDLLWHEYRGIRVTTLPAWKYWIKHLLYKATVAQAVSKASSILVPARTTKETICRYFPKQKNKVVVTKEGISALFLQPSFQTAHRKKRLVYVGSLYPHKNLKVILQALTSLPEFSLVIVGARNVFQERLKKQVTKLGIEQQVQFHGYLSDLDLVKLFSESFALVQPSLFEGFGLTGVEAMASGLPVIASDIPIFKEIYGNRATLFNPHSSSTFVKAVRHIQSNPFTREQLMNIAQTVKAEFSWHQMTQKTLETYQLALSNTK